MSDILSIIRGKQEGPLFGTTQPKQEYSTPMKAGEFFPKTGPPTHNPPKLTAEELVGEQGPRQAAPPRMTAQDFAGEQQPEVSVDEIELQQIQEMQRDELEMRSSVVARGRKFLDDAFRSVASGLTSGFSEEAGAFVESIIKNREYNEELALQRAREKSVDPTTRIIGELTGGVIQGIAPGGLVGTSVGAARMAKFAAIAATEGALAGFGHGEGDVINRAAGAAQGGAVGAVAGAAAPKVADLFVAGARRLMSHPGVGGAQKDAIQKLSRAMERDEITPERAMAKLRQLGPEGVIADLPGANVRGLARATAGVPGPARQIADTALSNRAVTAPRRVNDAITVAGSDESVVAARNALVTNRAAMARPLYEEAFLEPPLDTPAVNRLIEQSADIRDAIRQARRFPEYAEMPDNSVALLDKAYKNIGGKAMEATRAGNGEMARDLNRLRVTLRNHMPESYRRALDVFSDQSAFIDALDVGRQFIRTDTEVLAETVRGMTAGEREMFVIGISRAIREKLDNAQDSVSTARRIFGNEGIRDRLRIAIPGQFREFQRTMLQEAVFSKTANKILGGSPTAPRQAEVADLVSGGKALATMDPVGITSAIGRMVSAFKSTPTRQLGNTMFSHNQEDKQFILDQVLEQQMRGRLARPLAGGLTGAGSNAGATFGR